MKLWDKGYQIESAIENFTVGRDREMDLFLAPWDVLGTIAHITMLAEIGLLEKEELAVLKAELQYIYAEITAGNFGIEDGVEDVHSQVELMLTRKLGEAGKKVHAGRSRNDQVLVDLKLFFLSEIETIVALTRQLFDTLQHLSETHREILLPGYTHFQVAMPSSFGLWFGSYAESLIDDMHFVFAAWKVANQNPLGSAAGYGSSFPLNRTLTTQLLGFDTMSYNVVYAQMGRGKTEKLLSFALSSLGSTLNKLAADICLYMSQNFGFLTFPKELTTGSSIMPHKKNPDVWELIRAKTNRIQALPGEISMLITNLPSGYHRDLQLVKEIIIPGLEETKSCLRLADYMLQQVQINAQAAEGTQYDYMFSVETVNRLVMEGLPFREAYRQVGEAIAKGDFTAEREVSHTHEGSLGNLCTGEIREKMERAMNGFSFGQFHQAVEKLIR
ncbi:MAG: argininosuccinate lyase [Bacteroidia bacterium]